MLSCRGGPRASRPIAAAPRSALQPQHLTLRSGSARQCPQLAARPSRAHREQHLRAQGLVVRTFASAEEEDVKRTLVFVTSEVAPFSKTGGQQFASVVLGKGMPAHVIWADWWYLQCAGGLGDVVRDP